jgi:hypothetical protein
MPTQIMTEVIFSLVLPVFIKVIVLKWPTISNDPPVLIVAEDFDSLIASSLGQRRQWHSALGH